MVDFIEAEEVRSMIAEQTDGFIIFDVRDDDVGPVIPGAINAPSESFDIAIEKVYQKVKATRSTKVIFHCFKSSQRGPSCAREFLELIQSKEEAGTEDIGSIQVCVMRKGFERWNFIHRDEPHLIQKDLSEMEIIQ